MKIKEVSDEYILFDNGSEITFAHEQDCCEYNYADFKQLEEVAFEYEFEQDLIFEEVSKSGFRFGSKGTPMFFCSLLLRPEWILFFRYRYLL